MHIGFTYDMREEYLALGYGEEETAEFDSRKTIDAIASTLESLNFTIDRIGGGDALMERLLAGDRWDLVFNIAEGLRGLAREALVPALLDAHAIPYTFSDPVTLAVTLHKGITKRVVRDAGVPTPDFAVAASGADADDVRLPLPLFIKPVAEGTGKGVTPNSKITDISELRPRCEALITEFHQPVLIETFLPGREFTVGVVGAGRDACVVGILEVCLVGDADREAYTFANKEHYMNRVEYTLVRDAEALRAARIALDAWRVLECRDAGRVDLRSDADGNPQFIEVNPLAGIDPVKGDLPILCRLGGIDHRELLGTVMKRALARGCPGRDIPNAALLDTCEASLLAKARLSAPLDTCEASLLAKAHLSVPLYIVE